MSFAYIALAVVMSLMVTASGMMKMRRDPKVMKVIHEVVGVPLTFFPLLAACELAGAAGLLGGIVWRPLGLGASVGLVLYFTGAMVGHVRVGDFEGLGPAAFMLFLSAACFLLRLLGA